MNDKAVLFSHFWLIFGPTGAPQPTPEKTGCVPGRKFRVDFCFEAARVVIEVDGGQWSARGGRHNTDKDREKMNLLTLNGYRVLRYSPDMIEADPLKVVNQVASLVCPKTLPAHAEKAKPHVSHPRRRNPVAKSAPQQKPVGKNGAGRTGRRAAGRATGTKTGRANSPLLGLHKGQG